MALVHAISDEVEAAYRRGDLFEKRRRLMPDWAKYCGRKKDAGVCGPGRAVRPVDRAETVRPHPGRACHGDGKAVRVAYI